MSDNHFFGDFNLAHTAICKHMSFSENPSASNLLPLAGKKLYAAWVIAVYVVVVNVPLGCILYGLNHLARGSKLVGRLLLIIGIVGEIGLVWAVLIGRPPSPRPMYLINFLAAFCLYKFEKGPVKAAIQQGAGLARWWPPALFVLAASGILIGLISFTG